MRIDQSYLTLGSIVGTSWRPANTRIFRSPTRSKAATGDVATSTARTAVTSTRMAISLLGAPRPTGPQPRDGLQRAPHDLHRDGGRITYAGDGPSSRLRGRDRVAGDRRLDPRHRRRWQSLSGAPQHAQALSGGRGGVTARSDGPRGRRAGGGRLEHARPARRPGEAD